MSIIHPARNQLLPISLRALVWLAGVFLVYFVLNATVSGSVWAGMTASKSALTAEYCEFDNRQAFFRQSMNTYSNLVYFFLGVFICLIARHDGQTEKPGMRNRLAQFSGLSYLVGGCFIYLSFGSAFFHASLTWLGQRVDMNGTYALTISLLLVALYHVFYGITLSAQARKLLIPGAALLILALFEIALHVPSSILLPALILSIWTLLIVNYIQFRRDRSAVLGLLSFGLIIAAFYVRILDVQKVNCDPYSWYQGHSVWHLLAGLSSFCTYAFFRFGRLFPVKTIAPL